MILNIKKLVTLAIVFVLVLIPTIALAEVQIDSKIIEEARSIAEEKIILGEFTSPLTINLSTIKNGKQNINGKLTEGIRVSKDRTAIGVRDFVNLIYGLEIFWNESHRMVVIKSQNGKSIILPIDKNVIFTDGVMSRIDVAATIDASIGRTFLPMRTLANALGYEVSYDEETHTADLKEPGYVPSIKDAVGAEVPTMQSLIDPINKEFQKQNVVDSILSNKDKPEIKTVSRSVNTITGTVTKNYAEDIERDLMRLINDHRVQNGVKALEIDSNIKNLSDIRVAEVSANPNSNHIRPDGSSWDTVGNVNGENSAAISIRDNNAQALFNAWKSSSGHNANMLRSEFSSFYVSVIFDGENLYAVNLFKQ